MSIAPKTKMKKLSKKLCTRYACFYFPRACLSIFYGCQALYAARTYLVLFTGRALPALLRAAFPHSRVRIESTVSVRFCKRMKYTLISRLRDTVFNYLVL